MKTIYQSALESLGTDASPADLAPDELGCAETVSMVLKKVIPTFPVITGTASLKAYLDKSTLFRKTTTPQEGTIIVCATAPGHPFPGHTGIFLDNTRIASNDSTSGKFLQNYDITSWRMRWVDKGRYEIIMYQMI